MLLQSYVSKFKKILAMYSCSTYGTRHGKLFPRNSVVAPCGYPRIVVQNDTDFPHGCRGTSARADVDFPCGRARIFRADSG